MTPYRNKRVSSSLSKIPYGGFSPVRLQGRPLRRGLPVGRFGEACTRHTLASTRFASILRAPRGPTACPNQCQGAGLGDTPPFERRLSLYPRGPRSGPGYAVPVPHHFSAPSAPRAGTSRLHRHAASTRCLRWAGAPRRPTSGSELSLTVPSRPVVLRDPGKSVGCLHPVPSPTTLVFTQGGRARHFQKCAVSGLPTGSLALPPAELLASVTRLVLPGFRWVGRPSHRRV
jgi:hypothetical protein